MTDQEPMTIGRFARISGLSVHTLRHYDDVGILTPAEVDSVSGYRRYRRDQVRDARLIQALRWIELPLEEIRTALDDDSGNAINEILRLHRRRLERRASLVAGQLADIDYYLEKGLSMTPATGTRPVQLKIAVDDIDEASTSSSRPSVSTTTSLGAPTKATTRRSCSASTARMTSS